MKVIFFSNVRTMSGAENVLLDWLGTRPQIEPMVAVPRGSFFEACQRARVPVRRLLAPTELRRKEHPSWPLMFAVRCGVALPETTSMFLRNRPDLIHANNFAAGIYAALPARLAHIPMVWQIHDIIPFPSLEAKVLLRLESAASRFVAVSNAVRDSLLGLGLDPRKIVTIRNAVDACGRFDPSRSARGTVRSKLNAADEALIISMVGQIAEHKGSHLVVEAAARLFRNTDRDVRLVIAGVAPPQGVRYEDELKDLVSSSPILRDRITWLGHRTDVPEVLADSDVVVNASLVPEAFGMSILEGMAMGKVVVAPNAAGTAEVVEHGSDGFLFRPGDIDDLERTLAEVIRRHDHLDTVRKRAREKAVGDYDIRVKSDATLELYDRVMRRDASCSRLPR